MVLCMESAEKSFDPAQEGEFIPFSIWFLFSQLGVFVDGSAEDGYFVTELPCLRKTRSVTADFWKQRGPEMKIEEGESKTEITLSYIHGGHRVEGSVRYDAKEYRAEVFEELRGRSIAELDVIVRTLKDFFVAVGDDIVRFKMDFFPDTTSSVDDVQQWLNLSALLLSGHELIKGRLGIAQVMLEQRVMGEEALLDETPKSLRPWLNKKVWGWIPSHTQATAQRNE